MNLGPLDHLTPEDAALYAALYAERNYVPRGEAARVRRDAQAARAQADEWAAWETGGPWPSTDGDTPGDNPLPGYP